MQATAQLDVKRKELAVHLQKLGVGLGGLRKTLGTRTTNLFDQVASCQIYLSSGNLVTHNSAVPHGLQQSCRFPFGQESEQHSHAAHARDVLLVSVCGVPLLEEIDAFKAAWLCG